MVNFKLGKTKKVRIFILTIVITTILIIFLSILFSYAVTPTTNNNSNGNTPSTPTSAPGISSIPTPNEIINDESAIGNDYNNNKNAEFKNIKTNSGNPVNYKIFPYWKSGLPVSVDITPDSVKLLTCMSQIHVEQANQEQAKAQYAQTVKDLLKSLDLSDSNNFTTGIDETC